MHYFERRVEQSLAEYVCRQITSAGEAPWGRGNGPRITPAHCFGDWLWGMFYGWRSLPSSLQSLPESFGDGLAVVIVPHVDPFKDTRQYYKL